MELRTLRYFLALVEEGSLSNAAKALHVTQPTLSRQLAALEDELGQRLYIRGHNGITLTREGVILNRYAENIIDLADKATEEISEPEKGISGTVHIAAGETQLMCLIAHAMREVNREHPGINFEIYSGATAELMENFSRGLYDFFVECEARPHVSLNVLKLPYEDVWGVLIPRGNPLAELSEITAQDLCGQRVTLSRQAHKVGVIRRWAGECYDEYERIVHWNLPLNSKYLVMEGFGIALTYAGLFDDEGESLVFRPLKPRVTSTQGILWRKVPLSKAAQTFIDKVKEICADNELIERIKTTQRFTRYV